MPEHALSLCSCAFKKHELRSHINWLGNILARFPHTRLHFTFVSGAAISHERRRSHGAPQHQSTAPTHRYSAGRSVQFAFAFAPVRLCSKDNCDTSCPYIALCRIVVYELEESSFWWTHILLCGTYTLLHYLLTDYLHIGACICVYF